MELELKHLAGYLPYKLKWIIQGVNDFVMSGITGETLYTESGTVLTWLKHPDLPRALFPILRPLSSLIKEIEVDGKRFVPMLELIKIAIDQYDRGEGIIDSSEIIGALYGINRISVLLSYDVKCSLIYDSIQMKFIFNSPQNLMFACGYILFEKLYEWHFDIYELIDKGLAIAIKD
jgi:hypothetical protein